MESTSVSKFLIIPYSPDLKNDWDRFVDSSKNGTFILRRDYMDYHSDRFTDNSLLLYKGRNLYAVFPACLSGNQVISHAGLTYGGLLVNENCTSQSNLEAFTSIATYFKSKGVREIIYKPTPHIYHRLPSEEDLYALFRLKARLSARNVASVICADHRPKFRESRMSGVRKAARAGLSVSESCDFASFWEMLTSNLLTRHGATPVHTADEISRLHDKFPDSIRLFTVGTGDTLLGGTVIYVTPTVAHCQYISASPEGKRHGALDLLFLALINDTFADKRYFDFGTSNSDGGETLNESLIFQKEGFGGRAICYDTYSLPLSADFTPDTISAP